MAPWRRRDGPEDDGIWWPAVWRPLGIEEMWSTILNPRNLNLPLFEGLTEAIAFLKQDRACDPTAFDGRWWKWVEVDARWRSKLQLWPMQGLNTCRVFIASFHEEWSCLVHMAHGRMKTGRISFPFIWPKIAEIEFCANCWPAAWPSYIIKGVCHAWTSKTLAPFHSFSGEYGSRVHVTRQNQCKGSLQQLPMPNRAGFSQKLWHITWKLRKIAEGNTKVLSPKVHCCSSCQHHRVLHDVAGCSLSAV